MLSAASPALTWYGGEVKQYAGDLALSLLLVLLALRHLEDPLDMRRAIGAAGLGAVAMISSYAAVLTGAVLGAVLLWHWLREKSPETLRPLVVVGAGWGLGAAAATWAALRLTTPELRQYQREF